jgi:hypothetical protein
LHDGVHCSIIMVRSSSAVSRGMSARPAETHLWAVDGATFISSAILPVGVAHEAVFHRLFDVLLALDFGLGRCVALLAPRLALGLRRRLMSDRAIPDAARPAMGTHQT